MSSKRRGGLAVCVVVVAAVVAASSAPRADAVPNPWKFLGSIRQAWKQSDDAKLAFKVMRKASGAAISEWKKTEGAFCPWRTTVPAYCMNGWVVAVGRIDFYLETPAGTFHVGYVADGTILSAACITRDEAWVRILWPTQRVPSVFIENAWTRPWGTRPTVLPLC